MTLEEATSGRTPAIGLLELTSIARGVVACDAMAKRAPVEVVRSQTVCPGKYVVLIRGDEESVRESMEVGVHYAGGHLVDRIVIPNLHEQVVPALLATQPLPGLQAVGIIETFSVASTIAAADAACKAAQVTLIEVRMSNGLGGKAYVTMSGDQYAVEASVAAGVAAVESGLLLRSEVIPAPHPDLGKALL
jgi:microcompartment protein CcmL/EutN